MAGNVSGNLTNYYLFLTQIPNFAQQMDVNNDTMVTRNEFQNFFVQNWNGESSGAGLEMALVNQLFDQFNNVSGYGFVNGSSNFRNANVLFNTEIGDMNDMVQQYSVLGSFKERLEAIPGIEEFPKIISLTLIQLGALVAQNINNPDSETPIETLLEADFINFTNTSIKQYIPEDCLAKMADRPELEGLNYNCLNDQKLKSIITNFVNTAAQSSGGQLLSISEIQQGVNNIVDAYLSTALLGDADSDISILTQNGYDNTEINDLQKSRLEKAIKARIISLAGGDYSNHDLKGIYDSALTPLLNQVISNYDGDFSSLLSSVDTLELPQSIQDQIYKVKLVAELMDLEDHLSDSNSFDAKLLVALKEAVAHSDNEEMAFWVENASDLDAFCSYVIHAIMKSQTQIYNKIIQALLSDGNIDIHDEEQIIEFYVDYIQNNIGNILAKGAAGSGTGSGSGTTTGGGVWIGNISMDKDRLEKFDRLPADIEWSSSNSNNIVGPIDFGSFIKKDLASQFSEFENPLINWGKKPRSLQIDGSAQDINLSAVETIRNEITELYEAQIQKGGAFKEVASKVIGGGETKYREYLQDMDEAKLKETLNNLREELDIVERKEQRKADNKKANAFAQQLKDEASQNTKKLNLEM